MLFATRRGLVGQRRDSLTFTLPSQHNSTFCTLNSLNQRLNYNMHTFWNNTINAVMIAFSSIWGCLFFFHCLPIMISNSGISTPELLPAAATVALNPGCQWNCTTFCGDLSFNTSVLRQRHTHLVVAAQNKWCRLKENVKKSSQNCRLSLNFCYRYLHLMTSYVHGNIFFSIISTLPLSVKHNTVGYWPYPALILSFDAIFFFLPPLS